MARISADKIRQLEQDVAVERLVADDGVELHEDDGVLKGTCPRDGLPLTVDPQTNTWSCDGCAIEQGGPLQWVKLSQRVSNARAIDILKSRAGVEDEIQWPDDDGSLLEAVTDYYQRRLLQSEDAAGFLERRGIRDDGLIRHLRLGVSDRTLGYRLPSRNSTAGADLRTRLQSVGVLRGSGHEHLAGSLVVPVFDPNGVVVDLYGRKVSSKLRGGTPKHLFLGETPPHPWLLDPQSDGDEVVVTASVLDALTWWVVGHRLVLVAAQMAVTGDEIGTLLEGRNVQRVVFAYRRTDEARTIIEGTAQLIADLGMTVYRIVFPEGTDANDIHVQGADVSGLLRNAEWVASPASTSSPPPAPEPASDTYTTEPEPHGDEVILELGDRRWRVRGLGRNTSPETMRVNVMVTSQEGLHVDTFDLYAHRYRSGFVKAASVELGVQEQAIKADLGKVLLKLEELQDKAFQAQEDAKDEPPKMTPSQEAEALALLRDPKLMDRISQDLTNIGLVGEDANKIIVYLAATSRLLQDPLAVVIQSTSGSGKSTLLDGVLTMMPPESTKSFSAMTGQSLYYLGEDDLHHKVLSVAEEQGASRASYSLKLLQSEKSIKIASTGKDPGTGRLRTETYTVEGPVALMMTTTSPDVDEELANRCVVVSVDEGRDQTRAIHARQRHQETLQGLFGTMERDTIIEVHRNAQRLLRPLHVVNPFAQDLSFSDHATRTRRDHQKYLALIRAVTLLHQHQRQVKTAEQGTSKVEYIEVTHEDVKIANGLCHELLGRTLDDLLPQTRRLLELIHKWVEDRTNVLGIEIADFRFTRRMLREQVGWGQTQLRVHLSRLVEMEYVLAHRAGATTAVTYELAWFGEGEDGSPFVVGLVDPETLTGQGRRQNGHETAGERVVESVEKAEETASDRASADQPPENARRGSKRKSPSYRGGKG